jgi:hypothetical protein
MTGVAVQRCCGQRVWSRKTPLRVAEEVLFSTSFKYPPPQSAEGGRSIPPDFGFSVAVSLFPTEGRRDVVKDKRAARVTYYEGIKRAAVEQFKTTEEGLRKLQGLKPGQAEKLIADVHKRHEKLLKRIDQYIKDDRD